MTVQFDAQFEAVLADYHHRMEAETAFQQTLSPEEGMSRRDEFLLSVGSEVALFLNHMAKSAGAKTMLEVGTSYGYSTLFLAEAARATGGKVISLEISPEKAAYAREKMEQAGLSDVVEFRVDEGGGDF